LRTAKDFLAKNVLDKAFFLIEGHLPVYYWMKGYLGFVAPGTAAK
jgi:hypothetical protein